MALEPAWCGTFLAEITRADATEALEGIEAAKKLIELVIVGELLPVVHQTIFECRCCDRTITCRTGDDDTEFRSRGWKRIRGIDGPNAICPEDIRVAELEGLQFGEDGYEDAFVE